MRRIPILFALVALLACDDDDPTSPGSVSLNGTWRFTYTNMTGVVQGVAVTCNGTGFDFVITQTGTSFTGVQQGSGRVVCTAAGATIMDEPVASESITNGTIAGSTVTFQLGSIPGQHTATVSGTSMSGTAMWQYTEGTLALTLQGPFAATKQ